MFWNIILYNIAPLTILIGGIIMIVFGSRKVKRAESGKLLGWGITVTALILLFFALEISLYIAVGKALIGM